MTAEMPPLDMAPEHWDIVQNILQASIPKHEVWAFGSRAKGTAKPYSDLDLAVITETPLSIDTTAALNEAFSESDLPWKVDVVDWSLISEEFKRIISKDKILITAQSQRKKT